MPTQIIDFTREDMGGAPLILVAFALMALTTIRKKHLVEGWKKAIRTILFRVLVWTLLASPIVLFLEIWQRSPPQFFINLRLETDHVVLGYRWPKPELAIPISNITTATTIYEKRFRSSRSCSRIRIETAKAEFNSFGFHRLSDGEQLVWKRLLSSVEEQRVSSK